MSSILAKKQEEWNAKQLKELLLLPENKKCFDCPTKSPFFVNISIQTFVCTRCSGLVREVGHRVKSISASKFSGPEIVALQYGGNEVARSIWLSTYHSSTPDPENDGDVRMFMRQKYYEQKWLDRQKAIQHSENVKKIVTEMFAEDGTRRNSVGGTRAQLSLSPRQSLDTNRPASFIPPPRQSLDANRSSFIAPPRQSVDSTRPKFAPTQSWVDDNTPIGLIPAVKSLTEKTNNLLLDDDLLTQEPPSLPSPPQSSTSTTKQEFKIQSPSSFTSAPQSVPVKSDIFSELAELNPIKPVKSPTYSGGILQPNSPSSPSTSNSNPIPLSPQQNNNSKPIEVDPYAALRDLSFGTKPNSKPYTSGMFNDLYK